MLKVYLAGPDVFLPNAKEVGQEKVTICLAYGFQGLYPLDNEVPGAQIPFNSKEMGRLIYQGNMELIRSADLCFANISPFRGTDMDVGTAFEIGAFAALKKPVFGYTNTPESFFERTANCYAPLQGDGSPWHDKFGYAIENFDNHENLMIDNACAEIYTHTSKGHLHAMDAFEKCVRRVRYLLDAREHYGL